MKLVPVMDVRSGRVVHAAGGGRDGYAPLGRRFDVPDRPLELAARVRQRWGPRTLYLADLDALAGERPDLELVGRLAADGHRLRVDAGAAGARGALLLRDAGAAEVVVGLETLGGWGGLREAAGAVAPGRVVFSLDLREGTPVTAAWGAGRPPEAPGELARRAADAGAGRIVAMELARVGSGAGPDLTLLRRCRRAAPATPLTAAGGVRDADDVRAAGRSGCDECMVATALYGGALGPAVVERLEAARRGGGGEPGDGAGGG